MKRIIISMVIIAGSAVALSVGGTGAFFGDREASANNLFEAGAVDLTIDNKSYYNGAVSAATTWLDPSDLGNGLLFFNFTDLKPDDEGEDTISLHVNNNDAWACMDVSLTSNDDKSTTEPESAVDDPENTDDTWDGELAQNIRMAWWADDGDNVYEEGEQLLSNGIQTLYDLATTTGSFSVPLADADGNIWDGNGPIPGGETRYIGKAWCFGGMSATPFAQDSDLGPLDRGRRDLPATGPLLVIRRRPTARRSMSRFARCNRATTTLFSATGKRASRESLWLKP